MRLLYLYPSDLSDGLIDVICGGNVPYFDLSLQHVSKPLLRRMRRWGDGERFLRRIGDIRERRPDAAFRTNFIVGYPGETEEDHDQLLAFVDEAQLDWCGFFAYSKEEGTYAADLDGVVAAPLMAERLAELRERQDAITARRRERLIGEQIEVLVDRPGVGRSHREAPEIDGIVEIPEQLAVGSFVSVVVTGAMGPDLVAASRLMATSFGPSTLATPANGVTVARLLTAPLLFAMIEGTEGSWAAFLVWTALCVTDGIDGILARRHGTTHSGAFLDPLADKVLVLGAMFALVQEDVFWWLPVGLIAVREVAISMYRSFAGKQGITIPARRGAKLKTLCQQLAVGFALAPPLADERWLFNTFLWVAVVLTLCHGRAVPARRSPRGATTARVSLRCEVVAVGTELLLGQVVDTNSSWIGEQLALAGIDSHFQTKVGDNRGRIVSVLRLALDRSDAVIVCGGLGPTHDDITRECIAEVMGVELERDAAIADHIREMFESRGRRMADNNLRQADVPVGASDASRSAAAPPRV